MSAEVFMVHKNWAGACFVKTLEFFQQQGGETKEWGKAWQRVLANDIEDARRICKETIEPDPPVHQPAAVEQPTYTVCDACKGSGQGRGDVTYCGRCGGDGTIGVPAAPEPQGEALARKLQEMYECGGRMCSHCANLLMEARDLLATPPATAEAEQGAQSFPNATARDRADLLIRHSLSSAEWVGDQLMVVFEKQTLLKAIATALSTAPRPSIKTAPPCTVEGKK